MPLSFEALAEQARKRHSRRPANPGVHVEIEKPVPEGYRLVAPHDNSRVWLELLCDALGTRSETTAQALLCHLSQLCGQLWCPAEAGGEWVPDEAELNMILNMVTSIRPRNEMQAALAAQMVAVHLMTMKVAQKCLGSPSVDPHLASAAGKLARTFAIQTEVLSKLRGRRTSRQQITVRYENHEHQHVHIDGGSEENEGQPHAKDGNAHIAQMLSSDANGGALRITSCSRNACVQNARRKGIRSA